MLRRLVREYLVRLQGLRLVEQSAEGAEQVPEFDRLYRRRPAGAGRLGDRLARQPALLLGRPPFQPGRGLLELLVLDELLDQLSVVAELKELKANPKKPARGTCLEAMLTEGEGVLATLLVQDGTLHRGDVILCGAAYGRARAMYDDMGRPIQ